MSIYISNSIYLTGGGDYNANNPIIGYHSILLPANITSDTSSTRQPLNAWTPDTATVWEGLGYSGLPTTLTQNLILANPDNEDVDYIGIARHNIFTGGFFYTVQSSTDNGLTWDNVTTEQKASSDGAIVHYFNRRNHGLFRIRIRVTGGEIPAPIIGHVKLGRALVLQRRIYVGHSPATLSKKVKRVVHGSENGQYLGDIIQRTYYTCEISQENNSPAFVRANIVPFINHVNGQTEINDTAPTTFFFAWRPGDYPDEVVYGWTRDNIEPTNQGGDRMGGRMSWSCNVEAIA